MSRLPIGASPTGLQLLEHVNARFKTLFDAASFVLTSVGGTANAVTATLDPDLDGDGLLDGMGFLITWAAENTGGVTLALNGGSPLPVVGVDGAALFAGSIGPGLTSQLVFSGGNFILASPTLLMGGTSAARYFWVFETSGTWTKPDGLPDATPVLIAGWGGGGGGSVQNPGGGGGGGAYIRLLTRAGDIPSSVSVTIGAGGAAGAPGGGDNTTFGSLLTAYGGGVGSRGTVGEQSNSPIGGGGGGSHAKGVFGAAGATGGAISGGDSGNDARTEWGGGGGGGLYVSGSTVSAGHGGRAVYGGGGGGGDFSGTTNGGVSLYGGNGGNNGVAGQAPGGGGGRNAPGARGEIRVYI